MLRRPTVSRRPAHYHATRCPPTHTRFMSVAKLFGSWLAGQWCSSSEAGAKWLLGCGGGTGGRQASRKAPYQIYPLGLGLVERAALPSLLCDGGVRMCVRARRPLADRPTTCAFPLWCRAPAAPCLPPPPYTRTPTFSKLASVIYSEQMRRGAAALCGARCLCALANGSKPEGTPCSRVRVRRSQMRTAAHLVLGSSCVRRWRSSL